jgi:hypothetical protein
MGERSLHALPRAARGEGMTAAKCPLCAKPLSVRRTRPFVFCSHRCRQRAFDIRKRPERLAQRLANAQAAAEELATRIRESTDA